MLCGALLPKNSHIHPHVIIPGPRYRPGHISPSSTCDINLVFGDQVGGQFICIYQSHTPGHICKITFTPGRLNIHNCARFICTWRAYVYCNTVARAHRYPPSIQSPPSSLEILTNVLPLYPDSSKLKMRPLFMHRRTPPKTDNAHIIMYE